jgi:hypothetical protein
VQREEKSVKANAEHRALLIARDMMRRGWNPVPVPVGKNPNRKEWQLLTITSENVVTHFNKPDFNCGIQFRPRLHRGAAAGAAFPAADRLDIRTYQQARVTLALHLRVPGGSRLDQVDRR